MAIAGYLLDAEKSIVRLLNVRLDVGHLGGDVISGCGGGAGPLRHGGHVT